MYKNLPSYRENMSPKQLLDMMVAHIEYLEHVESRIDAALAKLESKPKSIGASESQLKKSAKAASKFKKLIR